MESRAFEGDLKTVLKASINSLQDMDYTITVLNSDIGFITASRTTEHREAALTNEKSDKSLTDGQKAVVAIGVIALIALFFAAIFGGDDDGRKKQGRSSGSIDLGDDHHDDGPDGPRIYRYKITINLTELAGGQTNVRVSASGEVEQDGKILSTGGVHELEFFQKFFAGMNQGLFLDQNVPINN